MKKFIKLLFGACALFNAGTFVWDWYHDHPPTGFLWLSAIWFTAVFGLECIGDAIVSPSKD